MVSTQSKTIVLGLRISEEMYHKLGEVSLEEDESMASIVRTAIKQYLRFRVRSERMKEGWGEHGVYRAQPVDG